MRHIVPMREKYCTHKAFDFITPSEYITRINVTDDEKSDTMTSTLWRKYIFKPELSGSLTGDEVVTILHPGESKTLIPVKKDGWISFAFSCSWASVIAGVALTVHFEYRHYMHVAKAAMREIFHSPSDAFWTGRAMDLIFDGIEIDCSTKDAMAKLVCSQFQRQQTFRAINNETFAFSFFGGVCSWLCFRLHNVQN